MIGQAEKLTGTMKTLQERGLPEDSYFRVTFADGSARTEHTLNWSQISEYRIVTIMGRKKAIHVCMFPVKRIEAFHEGLYAALDVPEGCKAYQAIRSECLIIPGLRRNDKATGRIIGMIRNGQVVQEYFLNGVEYTVQGVKI